MAVRKFSFVTLNESDQELERRNLDVVTGISGLGFKLTLSTIDTDIEDFISKITQQKVPITLTINHLKGYREANNLEAWLGSKINDTFCLEYDDTTVIRYVEGKVIESSKTELNQYGVLEQKIVFRPLTPFFKIIKNKIRIQVSDKGKSYPFKYPYCYGYNRIENNEINNTYFKDVPLIITINGSITNPIVTLSDEQDNIYNEVRILNTTLLEGQKLIINAAKKKVYIDRGLGKGVEDYYYNVDGAFDSYLRAIPMVKSKVGVNLTSSDTGYLEGSWRQYLL